MREYKILYPKLTFFLSAYFHSAWVDIYDWRKGTPSYQVVVRAFKAANSENEINQTAQELEQFLTHPLTEAELREIIVHELGANVNPQAKGLTYRQWCEIILDILKESP